jgi:hypothetical protein
MARVHFSELTSLSTPSLEVCGHPGSRGAGLGSPFLAAALRFFSRALASEAELLEPYTRTYSHTERSKREVKETAYTQRNLYMK